MVCERKRVSQCVLISHKSRSNIRAATPFAHFIESSAQLAARSKSSIKLVLCFEAVQGVRNLISSLEALMPHNATTAGHTATRVRLRSNYSSSLPSAVAVTTSTISMSCTMVASLCT